MTILRPILVALLCLFSCASFAQQNVALCPERPRLILIILVDNLNNQQLEIVRSRVGSKGFNRLCGYGTQLTDAYYDAGGNFVGKNLATLFTGAPASTHGIVARRWIDSFTGKKVDAVYGTLPDNERIDTLARPANGSLLCSTIGNEIRKIYNDRAKIFSVGFDPQMLVWSSATLGGEPIVWLDPRSGQMRTANVTDEKTIGWVSDFNSKNIADIYRQKTWAPSKDITTYHQYRFFPETQTNAKFYYPLTESSPLRYSAVCGSPYGNSLIRDVAAAAIAFEEMGRDDIPDLLTIQFTAQPSKGNKMQPLDPETEDLLMGLNENIASLLQMIDSTIGMDNTLVLLTAAQGAYDVAATSSAHWSERGFVSMRRATALLNLYLMALHGQEAWVKNYAPGSVYLDRELAEKKKVNFDTLLSQSTDFLVQVKGIGNAIAARHLNKITSHSPVVDAMRRNYHPKRSGDILVYLEPGWAEEYEDGTRLTQLWNGEFVPLVFYGWKVPRATIYARHNMADVAPTICSFMRIGQPNGCSGQPIPIVDYKASDNIKTSR